MGPEVKWATTITANLVNAIASGVDRYDCFFNFSFSVRVLDQLGVPSDHFAICPCISG